MDSNKELYISLAPIRGLPSFLDALGMLIVHLLWHHTQPLTKKDIRKHIREGKITPHPLKIDSVSIDNAIQLLVEQKKLDRIINNNKELFVINTDYSSILKQRLNLNNKIKHNAYNEWEKRMLQILKIVYYNSIDTLHEVWKQTIKILSNNMFNMNDNNNNNNYDTSILLSLHVVRTLISESHNDMVKYINYLLSSLIYTYKLSKPKDIRISKIIHIYIDTNILIYILGLIPKDKEELANDIRELIHKMISIGIEIKITKYTIEEYMAVIHKAINYYGEVGTSDYSNKDIVKHYKTSGSRLPARDYYSQYKNPIEACKRLYDINISEYAHEFATQIEGLPTVKKYEKSLRALGDKENIKHDAKVLAYIDAINGREDEYKITAIFLTMDTKLVKSINNPRVVRPDTLFLFYGELLPLTDMHQAFVQKLLLDTALPIALAKAHDIAAIVTEEINSNHSYEIIIENILLLEGVDIANDEQMEIVKLRAEDITNNIFNQIRELRQEILQEVKSIEDQKTINEIQLARRERDIAKLEKEIFELETKRNNSEISCKQKALLSLITTTAIPFIILIIMLNYIIQPFINLKIANGIIITIYTYFISKYYNYVLEQCYIKKNINNITNQIQKLERKLNHIKIH